jgi:tetratricopeptide (TPR) repeat protein
MLPSAMARRATATTATAVVKTARPQHHALRHHRQHHRCQSLVARRVGGTVVDDRRIVVTHATQSSSSSSTTNGGGERYANAAAAVNAGLALFEQKKFDEATSAFTQALGQSPNEDEARAASYNRACGYIKLNMYDEARDDLIAAVNEYNLKFKVLMNDPDLDAFRTSTQYNEVAAAVKGGRGASTMVNLRAEAQEPFRFLKLYLFGGLASGAGLGLFIIGTRLIKALQGGEDAPDMQETVTNLGINVVGLVVFGLLLKNELALRKQVIQKVEREEELGRLGVTLGDSSKNVLFSRLRGSYRVFIVAGSDGHILETLESLERFKDKLKDNKIVVLTVNMNEEASAEDDLPFGQRRRKARTSKTTELSASAAAMLLGGDKKLKLAPVDESAWRRWIINQIESSGFDPTVRDVFFSVAKNGTIWKSGAGVPNWMKLFDELPTEDSIQGKVTGV